MGSRGNCCDVLRNECPLQQIQEMVCSDISAYACSAVPSCLRRAYERRKELVQYRGPGYPAYRAGQNLHYSISCCTDYQKRRAVERLAHRLHPGNGDSGNRCRINYDAAGSGVLLNPCSDKRSGHLCRRGQHEAYPCFHCAAGAWCRDRHGR